MSVTCQILLNRPSRGVYRPGSDVTGTIKYAINEPLEINDIALALVGDAYCRWEETRTERRNNKSVTTRVTYTGSEKIISIRQSLLEKTTSTVTLQCGAYEKQFSFTLPYYIPPTYKDYHSEIKYLVKLKFSRPGIFTSAKRFQTEIKVNNYLDPNTSEGPVIFGLEKKLTKLFSAKKHIINLRAELDKSYSTPGQSPSIKIFIKNDASVTIPSIRSEFLSKTVYTATGGRSKESMNILKQCTIDSPPVFKNTEANLSSCVSIPSGLYSVQYSKVVSKQYFIRLTVKLPLPHIDANVDMPILIGDKCGTTQHMERTENKEEDETATDAPPSYWEVMQGDKIREVMEHN